MLFFPQLTDLNGGNWFHFQIAQRIKFSHAPFADQSGIVKASGCFVNFRQDPAFAFSRHHSSP
jgi:hypothetical protein